MEAMAVDQEQLVSNGFTESTSCCAINVRIKSLNAVRAKTFFYIMLVISCFVLFFLGFMTSWIISKSVESNNGHQTTPVPSNTVYNKGLHDEHCPTLLYRDDVINVHLIPHSHDDVGWLKTADQYFYGDRNDIQNAGVQYIIDSVVQALAADPNRRFVIVEMAFLSRWWHRQTNGTKELFRNMLRSGQIEIIGGGWAMPDEATTNYNAVIDLFTEGFAFINKEIDPDYRPYIAWQVDPFGHSRELASLFAEMGINGLFFARLDYQDLEQREKDKSTEMLWKLRPSTPQDNLSLFTSALADGTYCAQNGFDWDIQSNDSPIMDNPYLEGYNVDQRVTDFENNTLRRASHFPTNHLMATMGCDFNYGSASTWFLNMDSLIANVNAKSNKVRVFYSSPSCYTRAVQQSVKKLPLKSDDFFPYAESPGSFWTGYFSSRPALKIMVRNLINAFGTTRELLALSKINHQTIRQQLHYIKDTLGIMQHHDGISGTSKQAVTDDDRLRIDRSMAYSLNISASGLKSLICTGNQDCKFAYSDVNFCSLLNETYCPFTEQRTSFSVVLYDRLCDTTSPWLRIPIKTTNNTAVKVTDAAGNDVGFELWPILDDIKSIPTRSQSLANVELIFQVHVPPLGTTTYFVTMTENAMPIPFTYTITPANQVGSIENGALRIIIDGNGAMQTLINLQDNVTISFSHYLAYYLSEISPGKSSGAYRFNPNASELHFFPSPSDGIVVAGKQLTEIHQNYGPWAKAIVKLYQNEAHLSVQWIVGPIPTTYDGDGEERREIGREVVSMFTSSIDNQNTFLTDANGRELIERKTDSRPSWNFQPTQNVSQNYYPIVSRVSTKDSNAQLTIVADRAQGASGFRAGSIELMVHRRTTEDDNFGVGEALFEEENGHGLVLTGHHWIMMNSPNKAAANYRKVGNKLMFPYTVAFTPYSYDDWKQSNFAFSTSMGDRIDLSHGMPPLPLPVNVHLLTMEPDFMDCSLLLRLEHIYEAGEDAIFSKDTLVNVMNLVQQVLQADEDRIQIEERALAANMPVGDNVRVQWNDEIIGSNSVNDWSNVVMRPMDIRTFCAKVL